MRRIQVQTVLAVVLLVLPLSLAFTALPAMGSPPGPQPSEPAISSGSSGYSETVTATKTTTDANGVTTQSTIECLLTAGAPYYPPLGNKAYANSKIVCTAAVMSLDIKLYLSQGGALADSGLFSNSWQPGINAYASSSCGGYTMWTNVTYGRVVFPLGYTPPAVDLVASNQRKIDCVF